MLSERNDLVGATNPGLILRINGREEVAPWSSVLAVNAVLALVDRTSDRRIPVLILGVMVGGDELTFIVAESEPLWEPLVSIMPNVLPGIPLFEVWGVELAASGKVLIYERAGGLQ